MMDNTPKRGGEEGIKSKQEDSPQSVSSGNTDTTAQSKETTVSQVSDQPVPNQTPTLEEQQEGLPEEIKNKTYPSSSALSAEDELFEDLKSHSLLDSDKVIVLNQDGKAIWSMPTVFHQVALQKLLKIINKHSSGVEDPLLAQADIPLLVDKKKGRFKHPDVAIWGRNRLDTEDDDELDFDRRFITVEGWPGDMYMNPHVIIEFSWTNDIHSEIWKLQEQMVDHVQALGVVKLGFLIKAKPAQGTTYPTVLDRSVPLAGFDVYRFRAGEAAMADEPEPFLEYRVDAEEEHSMAIEISGADLDRSDQQGTVRIPLSSIRAVCEKFGLQFVGASDPA